MQITQLNSVLYGKNIAKCIYINHLWLYFYHIIIKYVDLTKNDTAAKSWHIWSKPYQKCLLVL